MTQFEHFVTALGLDMNSAALVRQALTHPSYINERGGEHADSNERMEYLGDAALELVVSDYLYRTFPKMSEGDMTTFRSLLVRRETLRRWAEELEIGERLLLGRGDARAGARARPVILAAAFEAVVGAIYLERGQAGVEAFLRPFIEREAAAVNANGLHNDYKNLLQEYTQRNLRQIPAYRVVAMEGSEHERRFEVVAEVDGHEVGRSTASNKQQAERQAAQQAYEAIERGDLVFTPPDLLPQNLVNSPPEEAANAHHDEEDGADPQA